MNNFLAEHTALLHDAARRRWLLFRHPIALYYAYHLTEVVPMLNAVEEHVNRAGLYAAGFVTYEAAPAFDPALMVKAPSDTPLAWFGMYNEPAVITMPLIGKSPAPELNWTPSISTATYKHAIRRVKAYIEAGDTYQVNFSFRLKTTDAFDPMELFILMNRAQNAQYSALITTPDWILCCASPELFFTLSGNELESHPMKGTVARGLSYADDCAQAAWLRQSAKNRAENLMIVDMVRNDMGRIATIGTVQTPHLFTIEQYPTLWQMTSAVRCATTASIPEIFRALFPPASITGAPKARTMQIITELEDSPRKTYTGATGFIAPGRHAQFNVTIRAALLDRRTGVAEYGVGGGIVWDSTETAEFEECFAKARILGQPLPDFALLETILWTPQDGYFLLENHLQRLQESAAYFAYPIDIAAVRQLLDATAESLPDYPYRVRLLVTKNGAPMIESSALQPIPSEPKPRIILARTPISSNNPFLYHKTTHRWVYDQAVRGCSGYNEVILWNEKGEVTEANIANIAVALNGELVTPPTHCGLLPGIYRNLLLTQGLVKERVVYVEELSHCSKIYLLNSVRRLWEVELVDEHALPLNDH